MKVNAEQYLASGRRVTHAFPKVPMGWPLWSFLICMMMPHTLAFYFGPLLLTPYRVVMLIAFVPIVVQIYRLQGNYLFADYAIIAFAAWTLACIMINYPGQERVEKAGQFALEAPLAYMLGRAFVDTPARLVRVFGVIFVIVAVSATVAVPEALTWRKPIIDLTSAITHIDPGYYDPGADIRMGMRRAQASFSNPILFGLFSASCVAFTWYTANGVASRLARVSVVILATFLSLSSAALLAMAMQFGIIGLEYATRRLQARSALITGTVLVVLIVLQFGTKSGAAGFIINHASLDPVTAYARVIIWDWGLKNIASHPLFGMIPETWVRPSFMDESMDNFFVFSGVLGGIPASVAQVSAIIATLWGVFRIARREVPPMMTALAHGYCAMLISIALAGFTVMFFDKMQPYFYFLLGIGSSLASFAERRFQLKSQPAAPYPDRITAAA